MTNINGINRILSGDGETVFYFTREMLISKVLIVEEVLYKQDGKFENRLSLVHFNNEDAQFYGLIHKDYIEAIEAYGIVKNIVEIFKGNEIDAFIEAVNILSCESMASSYQSKEEHKIQIRELVVDYFNHLESILDN